MKKWIKSRRFRWAIALLLALLVILGIGTFSLPYILISPAETTSADVILHYAIAYNTDADGYVAQLYQQKLAKKLYVSVRRRCAKSIRQITHDNI